MKSRNYQYDRPFRSQAIGFWLVLVRQRDENARAIFRNANRGMKFPLFFKLGVVSSKCRFFRFESDFVEDSLVGLTRLSIRDPFAEVMVVSNRKSVDLVDNG